MIQGDCGGGLNGLCDGLVNEDDIDPFSLLIGQSCTTECAGGDQGDGLSAQTLAVGMLAHVPADRHDWLRAKAATVPDRPSGERHAYWLAVCDLLAE